MRTEYAFTEYNLYPNTFYALPDTFLVGPATTIT